MTDTANEHIAIFMEVPTCDRHDECRHYKFGVGIYFTPEEMEYDTSWDWLMPACAKFSALEFMENELLEDHIHYCANIGEKLLEYDLQGTYERLVEGITWYNAQSK